DAASATEFGSRHHTGRYPGKRIDSRCRCRGVVLRAQDLLAIAAGTVSQDSAADTQAGYIFCGVGDFGSSIDVLALALPLLFAPRHSVHGEAVPAHLHRRLWRCLTLR